eukprot:4951915-Pyramimonas_sp.AAC.2
MSSWHQAPIHMKIGSLDEHKLGQGEAVGIAAQFSARSRVAVSLRFLAEHRVAHEHAHYLLLVMCPRVERLHDVSPAHRHVVVANQHRLRFAGR